MPRSKKRTTCPCIEVRLNEGIPTTAGVPTGCVGANVSWANMPESKPLRKPVGDVVIVGVEPGYIEGFAKWKRFKPRAGDTLTIRFLEAAEPDAPVAQHRYNPHTKRLSKVRKPKG